MVSMVIAVIVTCIAGLMIVKPEMFDGLFDYVKHVYGRGVAAFVVFPIIGVSIVTLWGYVLLYRHIRKVS